MKPLLLPALLLALASCDSADPGTATALPRDRALVMWYDDSLFAVHVGVNGQVGRPVVVQQAVGQVRMRDGFVNINELIEKERILTYAQDQTGRTGFPGRFFVEIKASDPLNPIPLGQPGEGLMVGYVSPTTGQAYGLRRDGNGEQWTVLRIERATSIPIATTSAIGPVDWPQALFVSDDEQVVAIPFIRRPDRILGDPQDLVILRSGRAEPVIVPDAARNVYDLRYVESTGQIYYVDFYVGTVSGIDPETGTRETLLGPLPHQEQSGRRLFVLDGGLVTFRRNIGSTSIFRYDLGTGAISEFSLPIGMGQAYEHGKYILLRSFDFEPDGLPTGPVGTFMGFCASALLGPSGPLTPAETFQVPIPHFTRQSASISHSFRCENGVPVG